MWDVKACRSCLATEGKLEKMSDVYKRIYAVITGFEISNGDGYPAYFCVECNMQIKKTLAFRRKCRRAFFVLKEIMAVRKQVTLSDVMTVDRKKTNLDTTHACTTKIITDIKPDNYEEIDRLEEQARLEKEARLEEEATLEGIDQGLDQEEPLDDMNLDLDDVFKDLEVDEVDEDDEEKDDEEKELVENKGDKARRRASHDPLVRQRREKWAEMEEFRQKARALADSEVRVLSDAEQARAFELRRRAEPYRSAIYKCAMCLITFASRLPLMDHVNMHNKRLSYAKHSCDVCKNRFPSEEALSKHRADFHLYEFKCGDCHSLAYTIEDLLKCYNAHGGPPPPDNKFKRKTPSFRHMFTTRRLPHEAMYLTLSEHSGLERNVCDRCNIGFYNQRVLDSHMAMHVEPGPGNKFKCSCDVCGLACASVGRLEVHMQEWHLYSYTCKRCGHVCMNSLQASHHYKQHAKDEPPPLAKKTFACTYCDKSFVQRRSLRAHRARAHAAERHCSACGRSQSSLYALYRHQLAAHGRISVGEPGVGDPRYRCGPCGVQFLDQPAYHTHLLCMGHQGADNIELGCKTHKLVFATVEQKLAHEEVCLHKIRNYPMQCQYCEVRLGGGHEHRRHHAQRHADVPYQPRAGGQRLCHACGKTVAYNGWRAHMLSHERAPLGCRCGTCGARASTPTLLAAHALCRHTRRPYRCALCPAEYTFRSECRDHILKVHAPEMPFQCPVCRRHFSHAEFVRDHARKAHGVLVKKTPWNKKHIQGKLFLYPYMKLDASGVGIDLLQQAKLEISDFTDTKMEVIPVEEYSQYVILDQHASPAAGSKRKLAKEYSFSGKKMKGIQDDRNFVIGPKVELEGAELGAGDGQKTVKRRVRKSKSDQATFKCERCEAVVTGAQAFVVHSLYNHTRFPYRCALCPSKHRYKADCRDHILKIHAPVTPYECTRCPERFSHVDALGAHSLAAHGVAHVPTAQAKTHSMRRKVFVYPHMKLDVQCISDEVLEKIDLLVYDYLEEDFTVADDYRYYVMTSSDEPIHKKIHIKSDESIIKTNQPTIVGRRMVSLDNDGEIDENDENTLEENVKVNKAINDEEIQEKCAKTRVYKSFDDIISIRTKQHIKSEESIIKTNQRTIVGRSMVSLDTDGEIDENYEEIQEKYDKTTVYISSDDPFHSRRKQPIKTEIIETNQRTSVGRSMVSLDADVEIDENYEEEFQGDEEIEGKYDETMVYGGADDETDDINDEAVVQIEETTLQGDESAKECVTVDVDGQNYEVIEHDGEQYVLIDGVLYKIENVSNDS